MSHRETAQSALQMQIRLAVSADIPRLMGLAKQVTTAPHWSREQYETALSGVPASRVVLVAEEEAGLQGFIVGKSLDEEWEIENIVVAAAVQRRGLGTRLLREFLDLARSKGADRIFLEVRESNLVARRLYENWAFVENGRRKRYYREPEEDAIVYQMRFG